MEEEDRDDDFIWRELTGCPSFYGCLMIEPSLGRETRESHYGAGHGMV